MAAYPDGSMATRVRLTPSVLVVNDALDEREMYSRTLRTAGYRAIEAATFVAAYQIATTKRLDVVVTDVRVAGSISGLDLTRRLRNHTRTSTVPIIVLTDASRPQDGDMALKAGADTFLEKPVPGPVLKEEIVRLLATSRPCFVNAVHSLRSEAWRRQAKASNARAAAEIQRNRAGAANPLGGRPTTSRPRTSLDSPCPWCGAAIEYRDRCPVLASQSPTPPNGDQRERLRYAAGWFCTNPSCDYGELC
jgi:DNA-binding response OmpR family regulator